jgi:hypothetical protein
MVQPDFSVSTGEKHWNQWHRQDSYTVAGTYLVGIAQMPENLLDECYQSILKIADTQPYDGKRAILALAEMFQDNSGRRSYDSQRSQNVRAADRQRIPLDRLRSRSPSRHAA